MYILGACEISSSAWLVWECSSSNLSLFYFNNSIIPILMSIFNEFNGYNGVLINGKKFYKDLGKPWAILRAPLIVNLSLEIGQILKYLVPAQKSLRNFELSLACVGKFQLEPIPNFFVLNFELGLARLGQF